MTSHLRIDIASLPEEGKLFSGQLSPLLLSLPKASIQALSPLTYNLYIQVFDKELMATGEIATILSLPCSRCLELVKISINQDTCLHKTLKHHGLIDLAMLLREEIFLNLPSYPKCSDGDEKKDCEINSLHLRLDNPPQSGLDTPPPASSSSPWEALDGLGNS